MEILIVGQLPPPVHGSNVMAERLVAALDSIGYQPVMVQKTFSKKVEDVDRFAVRKVFQIPLILCELILKGRGSKIKLCIFFLSLGPMSFLFDAILLLVLRLRKIPYLLYIHGVGICKLGNDSGMLCRWMVNATIPFARGAFVLGERIKPDIIRYVPEDCIFVLPNTLDVEECGALPIRSVSNKIKILFLSNIRLKKGVWEFLHVAKEVSKEYPDVEFLLAGPCRFPQLLEDIRSFIEQEKLDGQVRILGPIYGEEKEKLFRDCDIFLFPSHQEAFPLVVLEAMQWGLPVVSSDVGCIAEMISAGETGYLVAHTDISKMVEYITMLVRDADKRRAMGLAGHDRVSRLFTLKNYRFELSKGLNRFLEQRTLPEGY